MDLSVSTALYDCLAIYREDADGTYTGGLTGNVNFDTGRCSWSLGENSARENRMKTLLIGGTVVLTLLLPTTAHAHFHIKGKSRPCKSVVLQPGTDFAVASIRVKKMTCQQARSIGVSRVTHPESQPLPFRCVKRTRQGGHPNFWLGHTDYRCRDGRRVTVFVLS